MKSRRNSLAAQSYLNRGATKRIIKISCHVAKRTITADNKDCKPREIW